MNKHLQKAICTIEEMKQMNIEEIIELWNERSQQHPERALMIYENGSRQFFASAFKTNDLDARIFSLLTSLGTGDYSYNDKFVFYDKERDKFRSFSTTEDFIGILTKIIDKMKPRQDKLR